MEEKKQKFLKGDEDNFSVLPYSNILIFLYLFFHTLMKSFKGCLQQYF